MKFKEYINESALFTIENFAKQCAPFLRAIKGTNVLPYHGDPTVPEEWRIKYALANRQPRDSKKSLHHALNNFFKSKFNWRARSLGIFVVGDRNDAYAYGKLSVIFPIGDFRSLWSPDIADMTITYDNVARTIDTSDMTSSEAADAVLEMTLETVMGAEWKYNKELPEGLQSANEIILDADKFYQFNIVGKIFNEKVLPFLKSERIYHEG